MYSFSTSLIYVAFIISLSNGGTRAEFPSNVCSWSKVMPNGETQYSFIHMIRDSNVKRSSRLRLYHSVWSNVHTLMTCAWNSEAAVTESYLLLCQTRTSEFTKLHDERFNITLILESGGLCDAITTPAHQGRTGKRTSRSVNNDFIGLSLQDFHGNGETSKGEKHRRARRSFIVPGTLWCGSGNKAPSYADLGVFSDTDSCCREHDHCQNTILSFQARYGVFNTNIFTMSHCDCDNRFRSCLLMAKDSISNVVGYTFFNLLQLQCFEFTQKLQCVQRNWFGMCLASEMALYADVHPPTLYNATQIDHNFTETTIANYIFTSAQDSSNTDSMASTLEAESTTFTPSVPSTLETESTNLTTSVPSTLKTESTTLTPSVPSTLEAESTTLTPSVPSTLETESTTFTPSVPSTLEAESTTLTPSVPSTLEAEFTIFTPSVPSTLETESTNLTPSVPSTLETDSTNLTPSIPSTMETKSTTFTTSVPSTQEAESTTFTPSVPSTLEAEFTTFTPSVPSTMETKSTSLTPAVPSTLEAESTSLTPSIPSTLETESTSLTPSVPSTQETKSTNVAPSSAYAMTHSSAVDISIFGKAQKDTLLVLTKSGEKKKESGKGLLNLPHIDLSSLLNHDLHFPVQDTSNTDKQHDCEVYNDLDECRFRIPFLKQRYGLQNQEHRTVYHCDCTNRLFQALALQNELSRVQTFLLEYVFQSCFTLEPKNCTNKTSCRAVLAKADLPQLLHSRYSDAEESRRLMGLRPNGRRPKLRRTKRRNRTVRLQKLCRRITQSRTLRIKSVPSSHVHANLH